MHTLSAMTLTAILALSVAAEAQIIVTPMGNITDISGPNGQSSTQVDLGNGQGVIITNQSTSPIPLSASHLPPASSEFRQVGECASSGRSSRFQQSRAAVSPRHRVGLDRDHSREIEYGGTIRRLWDGRSLIHHLCALFGQERCHCYRAQGRL